MRDFTDRWLTFGLERTADSLTVYVYVDGKKTQQLRRGDKNDKGVPLAPVLFEGPMHIRFDLQSGGWGDDRTRDPESGTFEMDYLRVWKRAS